MRLAKAMCCIVLFCHYSALQAESAVSKFWNKEMPKNLGCGPGNTFFDDDSWLSTYLASSTNITFSPLLPTSTTSKISGCNGGPPIVEHRPSYQFFASNLHLIMEDASRGGGESLKSLAQLWNLDENNYRYLARQAKANFIDIFGNGNKPPSKIYDQLNAISSKG